MKNKIETIRTVGEMIDFLSQFDRDMILSAEYAKMFGTQVIDYVVNTIECGDNALQEIFKLKNCKILNRLGFSWSQQDTRNNIVLHLKDGVKTFNSVNQLVDYLQEAQYG